MDWDKLRIFHAVAEAGSFTHAGETLNLSQSAISRQISSLEDSIGVTLFHRHARGLLLTEEGELLQKAAKDIFGKMQMIESELLDSKKLPAGPLRITTTEFIGSTWLAPNISKLKKQYPDIQMTLLLDDRVYDLSMREADAAIRLYKPEQPDLIQRHLTRINQHIYAAQEYLDANGTPESVKDLKNHTLIGYPKNSSMPFADPNWLFRAAGIDPDEDYNTVMVNSMYAMLQAVTCGAGLATLPDYLVGQHKNLVKVLPGTQPPGVDMYFVYPEERRNSTRIAVFRDFLLELLNETEF